MRPFAGFFRSAGGEVKVGQCVFMNDGPTERNIDGQRYLKSGFVETDTTKFDTSIFTQRISAWTKQNSGFGQWGIVAVCAGLNGLGSPIWGIGGVNGKMAASSDAINWKEWNPGFGVDTIHDMVHNGTNLWVVAGFAGKLATSPDFQNWTLRTSTFSADNIYGVAYNAGLYVAVGGTGKIATSPDGITWTQRTSGVVSDLYTVAYGNGLWVAAGSMGRLLTSVNGIAWTDRTSTFGTQFIRRVRYSNDSNLFVAVGGNGKIATSPDGITWTARTSGSTRNLYGVSYANGTWLACGEGDETTGSGRIFISANGTNWEPTSSPFYGTVPENVTIGPTNKWLMVGSLGSAATALNIGPHAGAAVSVTDGSAIQYMRIS